MTFKLGDKVVINRNKPNCPIYTKGVVHRIENGLGRVLCEDDFYVWINLENGKIIDDIYGSWWVDRI